MSGLLPPPLPGDPERRHIEQSRSHWKLLNRWAAKAPPVAAQHEEAWREEHAGLIERLSAKGHDLETVTYFSKNSIGGGWITRMRCGACHDWYPERGGALGLGKERECEANHP